MDHENPAPEGLPDQPSGHLKITKSTSDASSHKHSEHEIREDASGRHERRLVTRERRVSKTTVSEFSEPPGGAAPTALLPTAWLENLPPKVRVRITGVRPAGCADAEEFDGEYILDLLESRPDQCRWELTLPPKCHLYRICLVATRSEGEAVRLRAFFEGSDKAPAWAGVVGTMRFAGAPLAFDSMTAINPCAGCLWPASVAAEPIFAERAYISPDPTVDDLLATADASSSGCSSGGAPGYTILGPRNVPGLSQYRYELGTPAGANITNIAWTVNKPTASISGADNEMEVSVIFQNTNPDWIQLKVTFDANGVRQIVRICIALVQVVVQTPAFSARGVAGTGSRSPFPFLVNAPLPPASPDWVIRHAPGSDCAAFTYNGTTQPPEPRVQAQSDGGGAGPAFAAVAMVKLIAPAQKPDALQHIEVGWLQTLDPISVSSKAHYTTQPPGGERVYTVPTFNTLDWLASPCSPGPTDEWPWYDRSAMRRGSGLGTWTSAAPGISMEDSPGLAIPLHGKRGAAHGRRDLDGGFTRPRNTSPVQSERRQRPECKRAAYHRILPIRLLFSHGCSHNRQ